MTLNIPQSLLKHLLLITVTFLVTERALTQPERFPQQLDRPVSLEPYARISLQAVNESSGLVKSRTWPDIFWTHNDSGDLPRIFPLQHDGKVIQPEWAENYQGILIPDAVNVDWEAITTDNAGNLIIADCGNNSNTRRDLTLYMIREPHPRETVTTRVWSSIRFYYPQQKQYPPAEKNYDCEAIFWRDGKIYLLTKNRGNSFTHLYRLDAQPSPEEQPAVYLERFHTRGKVTDADINPEGTRLAILSEKYIWLFEFPRDSEDFFKGKTSWFPLPVKYCESICFDGDRLLFSNEQGDLYQVYLNQFSELPASNREQN